MLPPPTAFALCRGAGDVVEKCIKIFVEAGLEIHNRRPPKTEPTTVLQSFADLGSTRDEHTQFG
jgi:hypothetical protein